MNREIVTQVIISSLIIIAILRIATTKIGAVWLRLCFIIVLGVMLSRRLDEIGIQFGLDVIPQFYTDLAAVLAVSSILIAFEHAHRKYETTKRRNAGRERDLEDMWTEYTNRPGSDSLLNVFTSPAQRTASTPDPSRSTYPPGKAIT